MGTTVTTQSDVRKELCAVCQAGFHALPPGALHLILMTLRGAGKCLSF